MDQSKYLYFLSNYKEMDIESLEEVSSRWDMLADEAKAALTAALAERNIAIDQPVGSGSTEPIIYPYPTWMTWIARVGMCLVGIMFIGVAKQLAHTATGNILGNIALIAAFCYAVLKFITRPPSTHPKKNYTKGDYMKFALIFALLATIAGFSLAKDVYVAPHVTRNGTVVEGYHRTSPDNNPYNNQSTQDNVNPYTGNTGTVQPASTYPT